MAVTESKPHILFIAPFPPPVHGAAMVSKQIHDSQVIRDSFICDYVNLSTSRNLSEVGGKKLVKCWRFLSAICLLFWKLTTHHFDLCYLAITCHGKGFLKDAPFVLICKLFRRKIIIHQHNKGMSNDIARWPYRQLLPLTYRNVTVILLSQRLYSDIESIVPAKSVAICPNGIPLPNSSPHERNNETPRLLFLSNLIESKGVIILLDALEILQSKGIRFYCDFVGGETREFDGRRFASEVAERKLSQVVNYYGIKTGREKESFFRRDDIFVFPTYNDCFPLVILEAMANGMPVVTTDEGGIPDMITDGINGLICKRQDIDSLAHCLELLLINPGLCRQMGQKGLQIIEDLYTQEAFEHRFIACLQKSL